MTDDELPPELTDAAHLAEFITLVLERRGPTDEFRLAQLLHKAGFDISGDRLGDGIREAGAVEVVGGDGVLLALGAASTAGHPAGGPGPDPSEPRLRHLLEHLPPQLLLLAVLLILVVSGLILGSLNAGVRGAPVMRFDPPTTTRPGG